jgi:site-specific DNA-methyltransferase (adenine-specific)
MELNKLICGDCLIVMKDIPDGSIDMVLTSPPYDNLRTYNGSLDWGEHIWKPVIKELFRIIKDGGVVVWVVGDATIKGSETGTSFKQALYFKEVGFNLHDTMIYQKTGCAHPDFTRYYQQFEYMFIFTKGEIKTFNQICDRKNKSAGRKPWGTERQKDGTTREAWNRKSGVVVKEYGARYNVWQIPNVTDRIHPATFPEKLAHDHIISWSNEGDTILDPFAGSGTVGKMAKQLNRNCILIEKDPAYCEIAEKRIAVGDKVDIELCSGDIDIFGA